MKCYASAIIAKCNPATPHLQLFLFMINTMQANVTKKATRSGRPSVNASLLIPQRKSNLKKYIKPNTIMATRLRANNPIIKIFFILSICYHKPITDKTLKFYVCFMSLVPPFHPLAVFGTNPFPASTQIHLGSYLKREDDVSCLLVISFLPMVFARQCWIPNQVGNNGVILYARIEIATPFVY
jgi:hypothetical protein